MTAPTTNELAIGAIDELIGELEVEFTEIRALPIHANTLTNNCTINQGGTRATCCHTK
jgi:large exoprotein involved in heme utilization and adhesion